MTNGEYFQEALWGVFPGFPGRGGSGNAYATLLLPDSWQRRALLEHSHHRQIDLGTLSASVNGMDVPFQIGARSYNDSKLVSLRNGKRLVIGGCPFVRAEIWRNGVHAGAQSYDLARDVVLEDNALGYIEVRMFTRDSLQEHRAATYCQEQDIGDWATVAAPNTGWAGSGLWRLPWQFALLAPAWLLPLAWVVACVAVHFEHINGDFADQQTPKLELLPFSPFLGLWYLHTWSWKVIFISKFVLFDKTHDQIHVENFQGRHFGRNQTQNVGTLHNFAQGL
jgi:hypothetical protein